MTKVKFGSYIFSQWEVEFMVLGVTKYWGFSGSARHPQLGRLKN